MMLPAFLVDPWEVGAHPNFDWAASYLEEVEIWLVCTQMALLLVVVVGEAVETAAPGREAAPETEEAVETVHDQVEVPVGMEDETFAHQVEEQLPLEDC